MKKVLFLASGSGSNIENIFQYFNQIPMDISYKIVSNKKNAGVFERAERLNIPITYFSKENFADGSFKKFVVAWNPDLIVLAGFLTILSPEFTTKWGSKMINIHPSLLPKYGGKGMYGTKVHQAVLDAGDSVSGATVHYVNAGVDEGEIITQGTFEIEEGDQIVDLQRKVAEVEKVILIDAIKKLSEQ